MHLFKAESSMATYVPYLKAILIFILEKCLTEFELLEVQGEALKFVKADVDYVLNITRNINNPINLYNRQRLIANLLLGYEPKVAFPTLKYLAVMNIGQSEMIKQRVPKNKYPQDILSFFDQYELTTKPDISYPDTTLLREEYCKNIGIMKNYLISALMNQTWTIPSIIKNPMLLAYEIDSTCLIELMVQEGCLLPIITPSFYGISPLYHLSFSYNVWYLKRLLRINSELIKIITPEALCTGPWDIPWESPLYLLAKSIGGVDILIEIFKDPLVVSKISLKAVTRLIWQDDDIGEEFKGLTLLDIFLEKSHLYPLLLKIIKASSDVVSGITAKHLIRFSRKEQLPILFYLAHNSTGKEILDYLFNQKPSLAENISAQTTSQPPSEREELNVRL